MDICMYTLDIISIRNLAKFPLEAQIDLGPIEVSAFGEPYGL
jgi:hypothetical protein